MKKFLNEKIEFFRTGMWEVERENLTVFQRVLLRILQISVVVVDDFRRAIVAASNHDKHTITARGV